VVADGVGPPAASQQSATQPSPASTNINNQLKTFMAEGGRSTAAVSVSPCTGAREKDLIEGVTPIHPLDVQDALIHHARKGAIIKSTYQLRVRVAGESRVPLSWIYIWRA
jgi:hypothetical protein